MWSLTAISLLVQPLPMSLKTSISRLDRVQRIAIFSSLKKVLSWTLSLDSNSVFIQVLKLKKSCQIQGTAVPIKLNQGTVELAVPIVFPRRQSPYSFVAKKSEKIRQTS